MDYSYLAGLLDGEGTATICWRVNKKTGFINPTPFISMSLKSNKREVDLIHSLMKEFGGGFYQYKSGKGELVAWRVAAKEELKKIILGLMPCLQLRKEEYNLLLEAIRIVEEDEKRFVMGYDKKTILKLAEISQKMRAYNSGKRRVKVWTYEKIKNYVENSPLYTKEHKLMRKGFFLRGGTNTRFVKGRELPENVEKKRLTRLRKALKERRKYSDETVLRARELDAEGYKITVIAKMINANKYTVYDWLRRGERL